MEAPGTIHLHRTNSDNAEFTALVLELDADLARRDGDDNVFYASLNKTDGLKTTLVAYVDNQPIACGAMREIGTGTMEIKRMYTRPGFRGRGVAGELLRGLEAWARELGYTRTVLETGKRQPEAIALYLKNGYAIIPNYGKYAGIDNSVCFAKDTYR